MDDFDENDTVINARNARIMAVFLCVLCVLVSLIFGNVRVFAAGIFLGGAVAQLLFRQHELTIGKSIGAANAQSVAVPTIWCDLSSRVRRFLLPSKTRM